MVNLLVAGIVLLLAWAVTTNFLGLTAGLGLVAGIIFVTLLIQTFGKIRVLPINLQFSMLLLVGTGLVIFGGALGIALPGQLGATPAITAPVTEVSQPGSLSECQSSIPDELKDDQATVTVRAVDRTNSTEITQIAGLAVYDSDTGVKYKDYDTDDTSSTFTVDLGKRIDIYVGNNSALYGSSLLNYCVKERNPTVELEVASIQSETGLEVVDYDDDCTTALTAGDVNDGKVTVGAGEDKNVCFRVKNTNADRVYDLAAYGTLAGRNITEFKPISVSSGPAVTFTEVVTPQHMKSVSVEMNNSASPTLSTSYSVWKINPVIRLDEFESVKHVFLIDASSSDPLDAWTACAVDNTIGTSECAYVAMITKDANWNEGADGKMVYDIHDHSESEADAGLDETDTSPEGGDTGIMLEVD